MTFPRLFPLLLIAFLLGSCRGDELVVPSQSQSIPEAAGPSGPLRGFYLLNEGNMGSNKSTLDFLDYRTGTYIRNLYAERNPHAVMELGDVGNDLAVYGSRLYAVINCSHKVEVLDAASALSLGHVDIPNCRSLAFDGPYAYVSSYVGPVGVDPNSPRGMVARIDTATLAVTATVTVGYQPEEIAIRDGMLYVANSGGYRAPNYDRTVSVVRLADMTVVDEIDVAPNLRCCRFDHNGRLWVSSRGDYAATPSSIHVLAPGPDGRYRPLQAFDVPCQNMAIHGSNLYYIAGPDPDARRERAVYGVIDVDMLSPTGLSFIDDGTEASITMPYGLDVNPATGEILITDARNYVSSGSVRCYSPEGKLLWEARTGDIPAHIAFVKR